MQKNHGLISFKASKYDGFLPKNPSKLSIFTSYFVCEICGRIIDRKNICKDSLDFASVPLMISKDELEYFLYAKRFSDRMIFSLSDFQKGYLLLSKGDKDLFYAVICTYSEENCFRLEDYVEKLSLCKDYIDSFCGRALSAKSARSAPDVFGTYLSGASEILNLCTPSYEDDGRKYAFSFDVLTDKILNLVQFASGAENARVTKDTSLHFRQIYFSLKEVQLLTSLMSLVCRHGKKDTLCVKMSLENDTALILLELDQSENVLQNGIFDKALLHACSPFSPLITQSDGKYRMSLQIKTSPEKGLSVSERDLSAKALEKSLYERAFQDALLVVAG